MSFNLVETSPFINVKLTNIGRRQLSLGKLTFSKAVLSDREIVYGIDRTGYYDIINNYVLSPADFHPDIDPVNLDGSAAVNLGTAEVVSAIQYITADTPSAGFFSGAPNQWTIEGPKYKGRGTIAYNQTWNDIQVSITTSYSVQDGDLLFVPWVAPQYGATYMNGTNLIASGSPANALWYRIISGSSGTYALDRPLPNFGSFSNAMTTPCFFYPWSGVSNFYSSAATQEVKIWNMNIARTHSIAGTDETIDGVSGYTRYGSIQYAGTRHYFGFDDEIPAVGFIHYSNRNSGNTYAEQFIEKSVQVYIPTLMWHNIGESNGKGSKWGASFFDQYGTTTYDTVAKTTYRDLRDGLSSSNKVVGRVYHKLKLIVITDQEILTALSYKSNRSYTLPEFNVSLTPSPKFPLTNSNAAGLCKKGYTYFVTYVAESDIYGSSTSFGYNNAIHCGYIKKIEGEADINGNPQFLQLTFPPNSFPYMRNETDLPLSGHGWNAQTVQVLVSEQLSTREYKEASVPEMQWKRISSATTGGNGVFKASDTSEATIDPLKLNGNTFVISSEDFISGTTYTLHSGCTTGQSTLNFGDESFFFGIVDLQVFATNYKSIITVTASNADYNSSINSTYDSALDNDTYITEIAILDDLNQVVAVGKPTTPLRKNSGRYLAFQLEIDY